MGSLATGQPVKEHLFVIFDRVFLLVIDPGPALRDPFKL
jgi:hypothetical protein